MNQCVSIISRVHLIFGTVLIAIILIEKKCLPVFNVYFQNRAFLVNSSVLMADVCEISLSVTDTWTAPQGRMN